MEWNIRRKQKMRRVVEREVLKRCDVWNRKYKEERNKTKIEGIRKDIRSDEVTEKYKYSSRKINNGMRIALNVISSSSSSSHPASDEEHLRATPEESEIK